MAMLLISATLCLLSIFEVCRCCHVDVLQEFDISKMTGPWWEYQTFNSNNLYDAYDHDCLTIKFYPDANGKKMTIVEDFIRRVPGAVNQDHTRRERPLTRNDYENEKSGLYSEDVTSAAIKIASYSYAVLETDYSTWLMAAFCSEDNSLGGYQILTTKQIMSESEQEEIEKKIKSVLKAKRIRRSTHTAKNNSGCKSVNFLKSLDD